MRQKHEYLLRKRGAIIHPMNIHAFAKLNIGGGCQYTPREEGARSFTRRERSRHARVQSESPGVVVAAIGWAQ